jgi:two-component system, response regulator PdtaR
MDLRCAGPSDPVPRCVLPSVPCLSPGPASILIVEDEALVRIAGVGIFADAGFRVIEAVDGEGAVEFLEAGSDVRLLFTDVDLPGAIDGLALAWRVRARWPHIGIIVASGRSVPQLPELPSGSRFHRKPYDAETVVRHAREMMVA